MKRWAVDSSKCPHIQHLFANRKPLFLKLSEVNTLSKWISQRRKLDFDGILDFHMALLGASKPISWRKMLYIEQTENVFDGHSCHSLEPASFTFPTRPFLRLASENISGKAIARGVGPHHVSCQNSTASPLPTLKTHHLVKSIASSYISFHSPKFMISKRSFFFGAVICLILEIWYRSLWISWPLMFIWRMYEDFQNIH